MSINNLTDRDYWRKYWQSYQYDKIPSKVPFRKFLPKLSSANSFIEIGGFPGVFAAYFYTKQKTSKVYLLDFYVDEEIVYKFERINDLSEGTINCIESDFFTFKSNEKYDIVFSFGFIEHFEDTKDVI